MCMKCGVRVRIERNSAYGNGIIMECLVCCCRKVQSLERESLMHYVFVHTNSVASVVLV